MSEGTEGGVLLCDESLFECFGEGAAPHSFANVRCFRLPDAAEKGMGFDTIALHGGYDPDPSVTYGLGQGDPRGKYRISSKKRASVPYGSRSMDVLL